MFWVFLWYYEGMSHPCFSDDVLDTWGFSSDSLRGSGVPWHSITVGVDDGHRVLLVLHSVILDGGLYFG